MNDTVKFELDGIELEAAPGTMLIEAADRAGIRIPRFCYHKKLSIAASCRMCLVEVEKAPKPMPACATPVAPGMRVFTRSPKAIAAQRGTLEFLLINHPLDCPICDQGGECELQDLSVGFGEDGSRYLEGKRVVPNPDLGSLIATDMNRCIHCTRCVRFGVEIAGVPELGATDRGDRMRIGTYVEQTLTSELSGNVVDLCPVGALTSKPFRFSARAWEMRQHPSVSHHDATGSNLYIHTLRGRVMRVVPRDNESINEVWLADRDRFSYEGLQSGERLLHPMIRVDGELVECDWTTALERAVELLRKSSGENLGMLLSPSSSLEEMVLAVRLANGLGCHNIDHRLAECDFRDQELIDQPPRLAAPIATFEELGGAVLIGTNLRKEQPLISHRLRKAALAGAQIFDINPAAFPSNYPLADRLIAEPAAMVDELAALLAARLEQAGETSPTGLATLLQGVAIEERHRSAARRLAAAGRVELLLGQIALAHPDRALLRSLAAALARSLSAGLSELPRGANAVGGWFAAALPHLTAAGAVRDVAGLDAVAMMGRPRGGYLLLGIEPDLDCWNGAEAMRALESAGVVALTPFVGKGLQQVADVLLPVAAFGESAGSLINIEGQLQQFNGATAPPGEARPAWKVFRVLGNLLDLDGFEQDSVADVVDAGLTKRLESVTTLPFADTGWRAGERLFTTDGCQRTGEVAPCSIDGLVRRAPSLQASADGWDGHVAISPAQAQTLLVGDGDRLTLTGSDGEVTLPLRIDPALAERSIALPGGVAESVAVGGLLSPLTLKKA